MYFAMILEQYDIKQMMHKRAKNLKFRSRHYVLSFGEMNTFENFYINVCEKTNVVDLLKKKFGKRCVHRPLGLSSIYGFLLPLWYLQTFYT